MTPPSPAGVLLAAGHGQALWFLTRGTGVVSLLLLSASMALGAVTSLRWESVRWPRFITATLHRNVSLLVLVFLAGHVATTVLDGFVPIHWLDAVVPFGGGYRPFWLGLGALACDLLLALVVTSLLRDRIGQRPWRLIHWSAYACWPLAMAHGFGTGFDAHQRWMLAVDATCLALVVGAVAWRALAPGPSGPTPLVRPRHHARSGIR